MKRMLQQDPVALILSYSDASSSTGLKGDAIEIDQTQTTVRLFISLECNLAEIRREDFWCSDAAIFLDQPALLSSIQIDHEDVDNELLSIHHKHPYLKWTLEIRFHPKGIFIYGVAPAPVQARMAFKINRFLSSSLPDSRGGREIA
ncbi:hypothetical protein [Undibacterium sp.]|uniref:hypothetical protein n=1 Tax=Undibacterium sp. TaxID=1914977 RepID=UPI00374D41AD